MIPRFITSRAPAAIAGAAMAVAVSSGPSFAFTLISPSATDQLIKSDVQQIYYYRRHYYHHHYYHRYYHPYYHHYYHPYYHHYYHSYYHHYYHPYYYHNYYHHSSTTITIITIIRIIIVIITISYINVTGAAAVDRLQAASGAQDRTRLCSAPLATPRPLKWRGTRHFVVQNSNDHQGHAVWFEVAEVANRSCVPESVRHSPSRSFGSKPGARQGSMTAHQLLKPTPPS